MVMQDAVPTGGVGGTIALTSTGTWIIYLDVTVDINGVMTAVSANAATTGQPANGDYDGYITIGQVIVGLDAHSNMVITSINQASTHSLRFGICGRQVVSGSLIAVGTFEFWGF